MNTDALAKGLFRRYCEHVRQDGGVVEYEAFEDQPEDLQESCRRQASDYFARVRLVGCEIVEASEASNARIVSRFSDDEIELMAEVEHRAWMEERLAAGWTYGDVKDAAEKTSPYLIPYDDLPESVKEYDRQPMREMQSVLSKAGLVIVKRSA